MRGFVSVRKIYEYAHGMRAKPTAAEMRFRDRIDATEIECHSQIVLGRYIADFLIPSKGLVIEVDGGYHDGGEQILKDIQRDEWLRSMGLSIMRIRNEDVNGFDVSRIHRTRTASEKAVKWCFKAVHASYNPRELKPRRTIDERRLNRPERQPKANQGNKPKKASKVRHYACIIPNGESKVVSGKPRNYMKLVMNKPGAWAKRFQTIEEAQAYINQWVKRRPSLSAPQKSTVSG